MSSAEPKLPARLERDSIVEAMCEIRFEPQTPGVASLLLGLLYQQFSSHKPKIENLPVSDLPQMVLDTQPNLKFVPKHKLEINNRVIAIGDRVINVACSPYPGWESFRERILEVWSAVTAHRDLLGELQRFSLKYVNILSEVTLDTLKKYTRVSANVSNGADPGWPMQLRVEFQNSPYVDIVQVASEATAQSHGTQMKGFLVDIDVICMDPSKNLLEEGDNDLNMVHSRAKRRFFELLTERAISERGAVYE